MIISAADLTAFATSILDHAGGNPEAARRVAARLVGANLTGHDSHGVGMIPAYVEGIHGRANCIRRPMAQSGAG
jgi:hydroxycarboxylate dehydrogenase B